MISQTAEYALRAAVCLAAEPGRPFTTPEIARLAQVPTGYLAKVMQSLVRSGLIRSRRGKGGGFVFATSPEEVTVLGVVSAVDPLHRRGGCPLGLPSHAGGLCPLHRRLDDAVASVERAFGATTVASLLDGPGPGVPLGLPSRRKMVKATAAAGAPPAAGRAPATRTPRRPAC
jgi:Rrf2 family protein